MNHPVLIFKAAVIPPTESNKDLSAHVPYCLYSDISRSFAMSYQISHSNPCFVLKWTCITSFVSKQIYHWFFQGSYTANEGFPAPWVINLRELLNFHFFQVNKHMFEERLFIFKVSFMAFERN